MTHTSLLVCLDPRARWWQLGPLPPAAGRLILVGWKQTPRSVDGGVPDVVAGALSRAMTSVARVTFPRSNGDAAPAPTWSTRGLDRIRLLPAAGVRAQLEAMLKGDIVLVSTRRPETAHSLFDDGGYPWWLQGQIVLLSAADAGPPDITREQFLALHGEDWAERAGRLAKAGVDAVVRPGVDGSVAGLLSLSEPFEQTLLQTCEAECRRVAIDWEVVTEDRLSRRLSGA